MRLQSALLFAAGALSAQAQLLAPAAPVITSAIAKRQNTDEPTGTTDPPPEETESDGGDGGGDGGGGDETTSEEETTTDGGGDDEDTTVFRTETVTDGDADTITRRTTVQSTSTFTVVVVATVFSTRTITEQGDTATRTIYETSTVTDDNAKRDFVDLGPRTLPIVEAYPTEVPVPTITSVDWNNYDMARNKMMQRDHLLNKRATVTEVRTVTVGDDSETTVVNTITETVVTTRRTVTTTTNVVTETEKEGASTTETVTSTLTVTETDVTTGAQTTTTGTGEEGDSNSSSDDDGGLSTGAKAGIGAGVGAGALLIIGAIAFFCIRRRRRGPKADPDAMAGASEVPVGGPVGGTPPMSHQTSTHHAAAAGLLSPHGRAPPTKPSPEGYRGTAMGDGRAGYAKPAPYGAAYAQQPSSTTSPTNRSSTLNSTSPFSPAGQTVSSIGADSLPAHPAPGDHQAAGGAAELGNEGNAAASRWQPAGGATEMDAQGVGHQSGALPQNVYEMPAQNYR